MRVPRISAMIILAVALLVAVASCAPMSFLNDPPPCRKVTPQSVTKAKYDQGQLIPVATGQEILAAWPGPEITVYSGPSEGALAVDVHATVCNLYIEIADGRGVKRENDRVHVAQVYKAEDGRNYVALWNRSGWIDTSHLRTWEPEK